MVDTNQPILDPRICSMFLLYFVNAFRSAITSNLGAYVVSGFEAHSLIPVIAIVGNVMSAASYMLVAKVLNLFDRSYGFAFMTLLGVVGLILSATCTNIATYCAAEVSPTRQPTYINAA
jgi:uncharacterized membrane protein